MGQRLNRHFSREDIQMKNKYVKRCSRKTQIKTTVRFHYVPIKMAKIKSSNHTKYRWSGGTGVLILCWWEYFSLNLQNKVFFLLLFNIFVLIFWLYLVNLPQQLNCFFELSFGKADAAHVIKRFSHFFTIVPIVDDLRLQWSL